MPLKSKVMQSARVACIALISRFVYLGVAFVSDLLLDDYDSSAFLNARPCSTSDAVPEALAIVNFADVWDTVFYDRISRCGYEYEHYYAFFPGLPAVMGVARGSAGRRIVLALTTSLVSFAISMIFFFRVGVKVLRDTDTATMAVFLMCLSPASVFLTMAYTESLFQMLTFCGVWLLINCDQPLLAALPYALSCAIRSNGMEQCYYLQYTTLAKSPTTYTGQSITGVELLKCKHLSMYLNHTRLISRAVGAGAINAGFFLWYIMQNVNQALLRRKRLLPAALCCLQAGLGIAMMTAVVLWILQQGHQQFCEADAWQDACQPRPYCQPGGPSLYSFIQSQYWGVGFFKYYQLKQIPNFVLAAPTLTLSFAAVASYYRHSPARFLSLGNMGTPQMRSFIHGLIHRPEKDSLVYGSLQERQGKASNFYQDTGFLSDGSFVFVAQLAAMAMFAALFMHIQVTTRFLTTCMALYWYMAYLVLSCKASTLPGKLVIVYCTVFAWIGLVLFPNFYPWT